MSSAEYQREWRAKHGARTGIRGRPRIRGCGTAAAACRHRRLGEPVDEACRLAWNAYQAERAAIRKAEAERAEAELRAKKDEKNRKTREARAAKRAEQEAASKPKAKVKVKR